MGPSCGLSSCGHDWAPVPDDPLGYPALVNFKDVFLAGIATGLLGSDFVMIQIQLTQSLGFCNSGRSLFRALAPTAHLTDLFWKLPDSCPAPNTDRVLGCPITLSLEHTDEGTGSPSKNKRGWAASKLQRAAYISFYRVWGRPTAGFSDPVYPVDL